MSGLPRGSWLANWGPAPKGSWRWRSGCTSRTSPGRRTRRRSAAGPDRRAHPLNGVDRGALSGSPRSSDSAPADVFVVPGPIDTATGGFRYDRRIVAELRAANFAIEPLELA